VLVVVEDRDVELRLEPRLDLEAPGEEIISRLMPPNPARDRLADGHDLVGLGRRQADRPASIPPNSLNRSAFPSMTGMAASGPMLPSPSTAVPSETTATVFCLIVRFMRVGSSAIASEMRATPGCTPSEDRPSS
jgi:hypothetical protein